MRHVLEPAGLTDAGVVPHHVESATGISRTEVGQGTVQSRLVRHVDDTGPQPLGAKFLAERRQAVAVAVYRTDSPAIGIEELGSLTAHATARASDKDRSHLAGLDHVFDAVQRFGHIADVAALAQKATEQPINTEPRCRVEAK